MTTSWGCKCTQCHRSSSWVDNLRKHLKEHSGDITNKCDHGGEKPKCASCVVLYIFGLTNVTSVTVTQLGTTVCGVYTARESLGVPSFS